MKNNILITLDSTCDFSPELLHEYGLEYMKMGVNIDDVEYKASLEWEDFTQEEFYKKMVELKKQNKRVFTVALNLEDIREYFIRWLNEGYDIIYIGCSSGLSASVKNGEKIAQELRPLFPDHKIYVLDPKMSGMGQGLFGIRASELRAEGKDIDEIYETLQEEVLHINQVGVVDDLNYLKLAGRVKASKAFFGNLFGVKPLLVTDINGSNIATQKAKGRKQAMEMAVQMTLDRIENSENRFVTISHADCEEDALQLKEMLIKANCPCKGYLISTLGPILGASCGPKTLKVDCFGKKVDLAPEE